MSEMKTIGLIGGMSWESTVPYYQIINEAVREKLGGLHSAKILLYSVDFAEIEALQARGEWDQSAGVLGEIAVRLEKAGADFIVICTNTMHKNAPAIQSMIHIPVLHIADATTAELKKHGIKKTVLLGTKYTMTQDFYKARIIADGIEVITPEGEDIDIVNEIIFNELCLGVIRDESRKAIRQIIHKLKERGAEAVILGCTEIGLLIRPEDSELPVFDTTLIHAQAAAEKALEACERPS